MNLISIIISIISRLEQEADLADDKMIESGSREYYDGYGDGVQYAIDLLRKVALNECNQKIAELEFARAQNLQLSLAARRSGESERSNP